MEKTRIHSPSRLDNMLKDLLKKYPTGVNGTVRKWDYQISHEWNASARVYRDTTVIAKDYRHYKTHRWWGYSPSDMIQMRKRVAKSGIRSYLREVDPDAGNRAISRRENILSHRIEKGAQAFKNEDGPAIWMVRVNYDNSVHVIASSTDSAKLIGRAMLAGCGITAKNEWDVRAERVDVPSIANCSHYNEESLNKATRNLKDAISEIESYKKKCKKLNLLIEALTEFGQSQVEMLKD